MTRIYLVAQNTFRQVLRQRLFLNIVIFGVGMVALAVVVSNITFGYQSRVIRSIGLSGITLAVDMMALLVAVGLIQGEIERKTLFVLLSQPISRTQYVLGRFAGLAATLAMVAVAFAGIFAFSLVLGRASIQVVDVVALAGGYVEALLLASFGLVLSAFTTPTLAAGIGLGFWIAASTTDDLVNLVRATEGGNQQLALFISWALPNLQRLNFREFAVYGEAVDAGLFAASILYGLLWTAAFLVLSSLILRQRQMV
jgi:ABC-type transport system involved in multi-copper enzyme maturation permease subunit